MARRKNDQRKITSSDIEKICNLLGAWSGPKITWDLVVEQVAGFVGHRWTRQALEKHEAIKEAYQRNRETLRMDGQARRVAPIDPAEVLMQQRIEVLEAEIAHLRNRIIAYQDLFIRHHYNAHKEGISEEQLAMPLPPIDRGQTDTE